MTPCLFVFCFICSGNADFEVDAEVLIFLATTETGALLLLFPRDLITKFSLKVH